MFCLDESTELTPRVIAKLIQKFTLNEQPKLIKWRDYYEGKHEILKKQHKDESRPCNKAVTNFAKVIADTYAGYIAGKPVSYTSNVDIADVQDAINYNDSAEQDIEFLMNALTYCTAYELHWVDANAQPRYAQVDPVNSFAVYDDTLDSNLLYFFRWYEADCLDDSDVYKLEVYGKSNVKIYRMHGQNGTPELQEEKAHFYGDVPVSVFKLNKSGENIFSQIITLNDAYNTLNSAEIDDYEAFVNAYLVFRNLDPKDTETIQSLNKMKDPRVMCLPDTVEASWLTKNVSDAQIENILGNLKENIFKVTACPDMADETFLAQSGTALAYKLVGFENVASGIVARFTKAIQRRIELICNILNMKASDAVWRDIQINFVRNLPVNLTELIQIINSLKGTVSDATLLAQLPFIKDVEAELEAVQAQKEANMAMFDFGSTSSNDTAVNDDDGDGEDEEDEV